MRLRFSFLSISAVTAFRDKRADLKHRRAEQAAAAAAAVAAAVEPIQCPVTGRPIDLNVSIEFEGRRVYFADATAREKFLDDPGQYAEAVRKQWDLMRPPRVQVLCPVTGKPVDPEVSTLWNGVPLLRFRGGEGDLGEGPAAAHAAKLEESYTFRPSARAATATSGRM